MTVTASTLAPEDRATGSPAVQGLLARLDDPRTAAALHDLLDNAELLSMLVSMVDGLVRRGETITGNLADGLAELRQATGGDTQHALAEARAALAAASGALPTLQALFTSSIAQPATVHALDTFAVALVTGLGEARASKKTGVRGLLAEMRDPATSRGLAILLSVARALGRTSRP